MAISPFRSKKQEIEDRVAKLTEEIKGLQPEKEQTSNEDYSVKLLELRERLKEYTGFDYSVIPESIVEAFIERIWVSKDEFRWYLRTGNNADGEFDPDDHIKIGAFTLTIDDEIELNATTKAQDSIPVFWWIERSKSNKKEEKRNAKL